MIKKTVIANVDGLINTGVAILYIAKGKEYTIDFATNREFAEVVSLGWVSDLEFSFK